MIFIFSYPILWILYLLNLNSKLSYALAFAIITPPFYIFTHKFLKRFQRLNKITVQSDYELDELYEKIYKSNFVNYKRVELKENTIFIYTQPSLWSIGEVIKIKKINRIFFIESEYPWLMEYFIPDVGIHKKNVKKVKKNYFS